MTARLPDSAHENNGRPVGSIPSECLVGHVTAAISTLDARES
jgi:hypothetical protein